MSTHQLAENSRRLASENSNGIQDAVARWGYHILDLMEKAEPPSVFSKKGFYGALMDWAMRDEQFKTQLFRFVDVLPVLATSGEVSRHLEEYLGDKENLPAAVRLGVKAAGSASWLVGAGVKSQVTGMAGQFMLGDDPKAIVSALRALNDRGIAFTVDVLGETVVSEAEADIYAQRYLDLINLLAPETLKWPACQGNQTPRGSVPALNVSVKLSAFYSQIHPADPDTAVEKISERLRPILRDAQTAGAFINFDMEHYGLKPLTLRLFKSIFSEGEFESGPACGIALQAYLRDSGTDLEDLLAWAETQKRRVGVRLVKGAYWDYETAVAAQRNWAVPVFTRKAESDANFELLSRRLLESVHIVEPAFGTHNVRSIANILALAERMGVNRRDFEFQMLRGMADPIKEAILELGCRLREYCPVGALLPGIAYFVRRLLENTSNEGFLARKFSKGAEAAELLRNPRELLQEDTATSESSRVSRSGFRNEALTDFNLPDERETVQTALGQVRSEFGKRHPLVINHRPIATANWLPSLNPANQDEVVGYAAQATVADAETALAAAREAQPAWGKVPAESRAEVLERVAALLHQNKAQLSALEILEAGKNWSEADADVAEAIDFCNYYAAIMRSEGRPRATQLVPGELNIQHWWPRGVGVVIAPWNFPLAILTGMTAAAVVSGNAVLVKPSEQTPVIAARLMELLVEAGLPPGVVNLVPGPGRDVGAHLVAHPQVDFIAFTGSKEVGLRIWESAGRTPPGQSNLKKVVCEMGGKNCIIVDGDADQDEAVQGCLAAAFGYQGQKCSALSRLVVLQQNYDRFLERLIAGASSLRIGPAEIPGNFIGPVISRSAQEGILSVIEEARQTLPLVWQGNVPEDPKACYVPPCIFTEVPSEHRLFREEIFGPVLAISIARDFDEALALANDSEFALTGGCYSRSPVHIRQAQQEFLCGNLYINRSITGALVERQPFGGFKMSGGGTKAGGREYLQNFMVPRVITENSLRRGFAPADHTLEET